MKKKKKTKKTESILHYKDGSCYLCNMLNTPYKGYTEEHHIFSGTSNRAKSEEYGLKVYLCLKHHRGDINGSAEAVHSNRKTDLILKGMAQWKFEETHSREEFIKEFGKSWL